MNGKDLFEAMSHVDERYIDEAESKMIPKTIPWIKLASMAACLCLLVLTVHSLRPFLRGNETEGVLIEDAQESAIGVPDDVPVGEVPSVILYVEDVTAVGFTGTVAELVDTDIFEVGMELNVVLADTPRYETADGKPSVSADFKINDYVMVQFIGYNRETSTIVVNVVQEVSEKG